MYGAHETAILRAEGQAVGKSQVPVKDSLVTSRVQEKSPNKNFTQYTIKGRFCIKQEQEERLPSQKSVLDSAGKKESSKKGPAAKLKGMSRKK